jgi:hypothetical protein
MPNFKIRATMTVTYIYEFEADTIEDAVDAVEGCEMEDDCFELDSDPPSVTEYTIEGQMGWNQWGKD